MTISLTNLPGNPADGAADYFRLDLPDVLTPALLTTLDGFCDRVEDTRVAVAALHITPAANPEQARRWPGDIGIHLVTKWERALRRIERLRAATIAIADGPCAGAGLEVLLATDYRIVTPAFRLTLRPPSGLPWPGMIVHRLSNQLGVARARRLVLFGGDLTAAQAVELGLVDESGPDIAERVAARAASFRGLAGAELAVRRRLLLDAPTTSFEDALGAHLAACDRTLRRGQQAAS
jgi:isomerase DpgB